MTKQEFIAEIAKKTKLPKSEVASIINTSLDLIAAKIKKEPVVLTGFGTFAVSKRKARTGRNPQTGAKIQIPAMKTPRFKAGRILKEAVR